MSQQVQQVEQRVGVRGRRWRDDWPVAVAAAVGAAVDWTVATQLAGVDLAVGSGSSTQRVGVVSVVVCAIVVTVAASGLLRMLEARTAHARRIWTAVALVVGLLSLVGPLGASSLQAGLSLVSLHAVVGSVVLGGLLCSPRRVA
jgi:uncharacterized protein DUF6069